MRVTTVFYDAVVKSNKGYSRVPSLAGDSEIEGKIFTPLPVLSPAIFFKMNEV